MTIETFIQPKITGYRQLTTEEAALLDEIKEHGAGLETLIQKLLSFPDNDKRWIAIGQTNLHQGMMALVRSVARPTSF